MKVQAKCQADHCSILTCCQLVWLFFLSGKTVSRESFQYFSIYPTKVIPIFHYSQSNKIKLYLKIWYTGCSCDLRNYGGYSNLHVHFLKPSCTYETFLSPTGATGPRFLRPCNRNIEYIDIAFVINQSRGIADQINLLQV